MSIQSLYMSKFVNTFPIEDAVVFATFMDFMGKSKSKTITVSTLCEKINQVFASKQIPPPPLIEPFGLRNRMIRWQNELEVITFEIDDKLQKVKVKISVEKGDSEKNSFIPEMVEVYKQYYPNTYTDAKFFGQLAKLRDRIVSAFNDKNIPVSEAGVVRSFQKLMDAFKEDSFDYMGSRDLANLLACYNKVVAYISDNKKTVVKKMETEKLFMQ